MRKLLLMLFSIAMLSTQLFAQTRTITGKITDENGNPLANSSVLVKGTSIGTTTKDDGTFSLNVPVGAKALVFSSVGHASQDINIGNKGIINASLKNSNTDLQEVVVTGYGITKSVRENTGAVSKINAAKVANEPVSSLDQALGGKTAGVQVNISSGVLADRTAIRVRGINSISSSSQPLVVVDGIPNLTTTNLNGFNGGNGTRFDPLALINASDIESIEVLKDAGAAVLYGSRAANGVILITTKKGKRGNIKVTVDSKVSWASATKNPPVLNGDDFTTIQNEKFANRFSATYPGQTLAKNSDINGDGVPDRTDWIAEIYRKGLTYDNSVSFAGGSDKFVVYGSARYLSQEGIVIANKLRSGQARLNMDFTPKSWFKAGIQMSYSKTLNNGILTDGYIAGASISGWQVPPNLSPYNPATPSGYNLTPAGLISQGNNTTSIPAIGNFLPSASYYYNPLSQSYLNRNDNTADELRFNIYGEITPYKGLKFTSKFGYQNQPNFEDQYSSPYVAGLGTPYGGLVQDQTSTNTQWVWQNYLNYDITIKGRHRIGAVAGAEYQHNKFFQLYTGANNFTDPFFQNVVGGAYTNTLPGTSTLLDNTGGDLFSNGFISYFGRLAYTFDNKYYVEGAIRRDGFSGFGSANQFGNFPSISLGWDISKENFMSDIKWIDFLKLRGSYGVVGNSRGVSSYASRTLYGGAAYTSFNGLGITQAGNAGLQWESSKKLNLGFDATFLKNRLNVTVDYFKNDIDKLILAAPVLYTVGVPNSSITSNIGSMYNKGIEITLSGTPIRTRDFTWSSSFNFTRVWNKVTALVPSNNNADIFDGNNVASLDRQLGLYFLPTWVGVDPASGNPVFKNGKTGGNKMWDFTSQKWYDEKGIVTTAVSSTNGDYNYTDKSGLPTFYGGWDNTFTYKQIDLGVNITYQGGNYIYNSTKAGMLTNFFSNNFDAILSRWQKPGDKTDIARLYQNDNTANIASTRWLEKGDYIRIRTITLGYNLSKSLLDKIGFQGFRFYVQAYNPFTITKYSGLDPEVNSNAFTNIAVGVDNRATPQARVLTVGLNLTF